MRTTVDLTRAGMLLSPGLCALALGRNDLASQDACDRLFYAAGIGWNEYALLVGVV